VWNEWYHRVMCRGEEIQEVLTSQAKKQRNNDAAGQKRGGKSTPERGEFGDRAYKPEEEQKEKSVSRSIF